MFPNDICSQETDIRARNKEHANQSIENMQAMEHQDSLSLI
jgi:hypothetical protein